MNTTTTHPDYKVSHPPQANNRSYHATAYTSGGEPLGEIRVVAKSDTAAKKATQVWARGLGAAKWGLVGLFGILRELKGDLHYKPKLITKEKQLVGKTITKVRRLERMGFCDKAWLELVFSDGTRAILESDRKGFSPQAVCEYPQDLALRKTDEGLTRAGRARRKPVQEEQPPIVTGGTTWAKNSNYRHL